MATERATTATASFRAALEAGDALTRHEACERFGITGATFRWAIKRMLDDGVPLEFELVAGRRGSSSLKRWRIAGQRGLHRGRGTGPTSAKGRRESPRR